MKKSILELAKELDFTTEQEYFEYIIDSEINGQRQQVKRLIKALKKDDIKTFIFWLDDYDGADYEVCRKVAINLL
jgi:ABC-type metal ion transport system substrate-binding protein